MNPKSAIKASYISLPPYQDSDDLKLRVWREAREFAQRKRSDGQSRSPRQGFCVNVRFARSDRRMSRQNAESAVDEELTNEAKVR